jgi:hypothetical protein
MAGELNDAALGGDPDMPCGNDGLSAQFVEHGLPQLTVCGHDDVLGWPEGECQAEDRDGNVSRMRSSNVWSAAAAYLLSMPAKPNPGEPD